MRTNHIRLNEMKQPRQPSRNRRIDRTIGLTVWSFNYLWLIAVSLAQPGAAYFDRTSQIVAFESRISSGTAREVCAEVAVTQIVQGPEYSASTGTTVFVECPGPCPFQNITTDTSWTHFSAEYGGLGPKPDAPRCGGYINANISSLGFSCPEIASTRGSCVLNLSNGSYLGTESCTWCGLIWERVADL